MGGLASWSPSTARRGLPAAPREHQARRGGTLRSVPEDPAQELLKTIGNLAEFHREHEKFSQAPLRTSADVQAASRAAQPWLSADNLLVRDICEFQGFRMLEPPRCAAVSHPVHDS
jgi:hypothetical protein